MYWRATPCSPLVERADGLYAPLRTPRDWAFSALGLGVLVAVMAWQWAQRSPGQRSTLLGYYALILAPSLWYAAKRWRARRRHGDWGAPYVSVANGSVALALPGHVERSALQVPVSELRSLVIYGHHGARRFEFQRVRGRSETVHPMFSAAVERQIVPFLQAKLAPHVPVEVRPPPTFFEEVRGE